MTQHIEMIIVMHAPDSDASCGLVIDMLSSEEFTGTSSVWPLFVIKWQPFLICDPFCIVVPAMGVDEIYDVQALGKMYAMKLTNR